MYLYICVIYVTYIIYLISLCMKYLIIKLRFCNYIYTLKRFLIRNLSEFLEPTVGDHQFMDGLESAVDWKATL